MKWEQLCTILDEFEGGSPYENAVVVLYGSDSANPIKVEFKRGSYELLSGDNLLVIRYTFEPEDEMVAKILRMAASKRIGATYVPADSIMAVELYTEA